MEAGVDSERAEPRANSDTKRDQSAAEKLGLEPDTLRRLHVTLGNEETRFGAKARVLHI